MWNGELSSFHPNGNLMIYLQYQGKNLVLSIPKDELVIRTCFLSKPYSKKNGKDSRSLMAKIIECTGCVVNKNPFIFQYVFEEGKAILAIDWKSLSMIDSQAFITVELTAKYHFRKTINLHVLWVEKYLNFIPSLNLTGRGRIKIGVLKIAKVCDESELQKLEKTRHEIEIGDEFYTKDGSRVVVTVEDNVDDNIGRSLAKSNTFNISFSESREIEVFMDFGKSGIKEPFEYILKTIFNGETANFKRNSITINPRIPQIKPRLEWSESELAKKQDEDIPYLPLQAASKEIGFFFLGTDAISGEQSLDYSLTTDSEILTLQGNLDNTIQPLEPDHKFSLVYNGDKLAQLPETSIIVKILNNGEEIDRVVLSK